MDADSLAGYKKLGLDAVVGGNLTPARNMILNAASEMGKVAVEVSDDISRWTYYDIDKQDVRGETKFTKANQARASRRSFSSRPWVLHNGYWQK